MRTRDRKSRGGRLGLLPPGVCRPHRLKVDTKRRGMSSPVPSRGGRGSGGGAVVPPLAGGGRRGTCVRLQPRPLLAELGVETPQTHGAGGPHEGSAAFEIHRLPAGSWVLAAWRQGAHRACCPHHHGGTVSWLSWLPPAFGAGRGEGVFAVCTGRTVARGGRLCMGRREDWGGRLCPGRREACGGRMAAVTGAAGLLGAVRGREAGGFCSFGRRICFYGSSALSGSGSGFTGRLNRKYRERPPRGRGGGPAGGVAGASGCPPPPTVRSHPLTASRVPTSCMSAGAGRALQRRDQH